MKDSNISLIAGAALVGMAVLSIAGVFDGRLSFDNQPDSMAAQLYTANAATGVLASNVPPSAHHVPH